jgi:hypothetical protein
MPLTLPTTPGFCVYLGRLPDLHPQNATSITSYSGFAYAPELNALLKFGGGHSATPAPAIYRYDLTAGAWTLDYPVPPLAALVAANHRVGNYWEIPGHTPSIMPASRHTYEGNVWHPELQRLIVNANNNANGNNPALPGGYSGTGGGNRAHYDPAAKTWEISTVAGTHNGAHCLDPISGNIIAIDNPISGNPPAQWTVYNPRTKALLFAANPYNPAFFDSGYKGSGIFGYTETITYHPPSDTFYYLSNNKALWEIKLDRTTWKPKFRNVVVPVPFTSYRVRPFAYDSARDVIVGALGGGIMYGFKRTGIGTGVWYKHPAAPATNNGSSWAQAYVPSLDAHFFIGQSGTDSARHLYAFRWDEAKAEPIPNPNLPAATITVAGQTVTSMGAAAAIGGEVRLSAGGVYGAAAIAQIDKPINIIGAATEVGNAAIGGKGIFIVNADARFENVTLLGAKVPDGNGAGVRWQAGNLTLENVTLRANQNGILGGDGAGLLIVNACTVKQNGDGTGQTHGLYIGTCAEARITASKFSENYIGHHVKSRAVKTLVDGCELGDNLLGTESYNVDCPNGGDVTISNCVMRQGAKSDNSYMVSYFAEQRDTHPVNTLAVRDCTLESQGINGTGIWNRRADTVALIERVNFVGSFTLLAKGYHKLRGCKRDGVAIPDVDVLPTQTDTTPPAAPAADLNATIARTADMYSITVRGSAGAEPDIAKVVARINGGAIVETPTGASNQFELVLQHPTKGDVQLEYAYVDGVGNQSAWHAQTLTVPDMEAPAAPAGDLDVVSVVWVA